MVKVKLKNNGAASDGKAGTGAGPLQRLTRYGDDENRAERYVPSFPGSEVVFLLWR